MPFLKYCFNITEMSRKTTQWKKKQQNTFKAKEEKLLRMDWTFLSYMLMLSLQLLHYMNFVWPITHVQILKCEWKRVYRQGWEFCSVYPKHDGYKRSKCQAQCLGVSKIHSLLKHLIKPWHTTSHTCPSDSAAVSQHDSLDPVRRHLWSYTHVTNNAAFIGVMKFWLRQ